MQSPEIHRLAAFTDDPAGGNPAGVVITDQPLDASTMQRIAADVGYSETAFLTPEKDRMYRVRYFAPTSEVPFCGHATIAAGVLLGERLGTGRLRFATPAGPVDVDVTRRADGAPLATLTSVEPRVEPLDERSLATAIGLLGLTPDDLDDAFTPAIGFAGARHLLIVLRRRATLATLDYDFEGLRGWMDERDLTTAALLWRDSDARWHARNAFPVGGVVEDPATGAAAAAFGGYLREGGHLRPPASLEIIQGEDMGRPSSILVDVDRTGGIAVTGRAVPLGTG